MSNLRTTPVVWWECGAFFALEVQRVLQDYHDLPADMLALPIRCFHIVNSIAEDPSRAVKLGDELALCYSSAPELVARLLPLLTDYHSSEKGPLEQLAVASATLEFVDPTQTDADLMRIDSNVELRLATWAEVDERLRNDNPPVTFQPATKGKAKRRGDTEDYRVRIYACRESKRRGDILKLWAAHIEEFWPSSDK